MVKGRGYIFTEFSHTFEWNIPQAVTHTLTDTHTHNIVHAYYCIIKNLFIFPFQTLKKMESNAQQLVQFKPNLFFKNLVLFWCCVLCCLPLLCQCKVCAFYANLYFVVFVELRINFIKSKKRITHSFTWNFDKSFRLPPGLLLSTYCFCFSSLSVHTLSECSTGRV